MVKSIGNLNRHIEIVRISSTVDGDGYPTENRIVVCRCLASVEDGTYRTNEYFTAQAGRATEVVQFTVRDAIVRKYGVRPGMLVIYQGAKHEILTLYDAKHARDFVCINTKIERMVSG